MIALRLDDLKQYSDVLRAKNGSEIKVRFVEPRDREELQNYIRSLTAASRYNRFLGALSELPNTELERFIHALRRLLRDQEAAERRHCDRPLDLGGNEFNERPARTATGVIDHNIRCSDLALDQAEQPLDLLRLGGIAGIGARAGFSAERAELLDAAGAKCDANSLPRK